MNGEQHYRLGQEIALPCDCDPANRCVLCEHSGTRHVRLGVVTMQLMNLARAEALRNDQLVERPAGDVADNGTIHRCPACGYTTHLASIDGGINCCGPSDAPHESTPMIEGRFVALDGEVDRA